MSLARACPCLGPAARLVRINTGGSLDRRSPVGGRFRVMAQYYYVSRNYARRSSCRPSGRLASKAESNYSAWYSAAGTAVTVVRRASIHLGHRPGRRNRNAPIERNAAPPEPGSDGRLVEG